MSNLVDTSVLLAPATLRRHTLEGGWAVSVVTVGELEAGVLMARDPSERAARLRHLTELVAEANTVPVDRMVAARFGELRAETGRIPSSDLWIAATALANDFLLVTRDERQAKLPLLRSTLLG